jgi:hypothetical protein
MAVAVGDRIIEALQRFERTQQREKSKTAFLAPGLPDGNIFKPKKSQYG